MLIRPKAEWKQTFKINTWKEVGKVMLWIPLFIVWLLSYMQMIICFLVSLFKVPLLTVF